MSLAIASPTPAESGLQTAKLMNSGGIDPERWVDEHGDYLFHYALSRLRDHHLAEELVQEALLSALRATGRFEGRSSERTWLVGILKNKILDYFRKVGRETTFTDLEFYESEDRQQYDHPSVPNHWVAELAPSEWDCAGAELDREAFWKVFHHCTSRLPDKIAKVFLLRELDDLSTEEICSTLAITPGNLWVMLHRARSALRRCLENHWFADVRANGEAAP